MRTTLTDISISTNQHLIDGGCEIVSVQVVRGCLTRGVHVWFEGLVEYARPAYSRMFACGLLEELPKLPPLVSLVVRLSAVPDTCWFQLEAIANKQPCEHDAHTTTTANISRDVYHIMTTVARSVGGCTLGILEAGSVHLAET